MPEAGGVGNRFFFSGRPEKFMFFFFSFPGLKEGLSKKGARMCEVFETVDIFLFGMGSMSIAERKGGGVEGQRREKREKDRERERERERQRGREEREREERNGDAQRKRSLQNVCENRPKGPDIQV